MYKKLSEEEEILFETLSQPRGFCETIFSSIDNLMEFDGEIFSSIRSYQEPMQSYEYSVGDDDQSDDKKNFNRRKSAGDGFAIAARLIGKSRVFLVLDIIQSIVFLAGWETALGSYDASHIRKIFQDFSPAIDYHPCFKGLRQNYNQTPQHLFTAKNGFKIVGINEDVVNPKKAGSAWFAWHTKKMWYEEFSLTNQVATDKREFSKAEVGCIFRASGMSNITKHTPAGNIYDDQSLKHLVMSYPLFVNPSWGEDMKAERLKEYKTTTSMSWKMYVLGELIEDGYSPLDMELVRACYNQEKEVKRFDITKKNFDYFENLIIIDKPQDTKRVFISGDIGTTAPTEINIIFDNDIKLKYRYNITLNKLTDKQIYLVFKWLAETLSADCVGIDCGDGTGKSIVRQLLEDFPQENIFPYDGSSKIVVGFSKDDKGNVKYNDKGEPIVQEEYMSEWSVLHLRDLFYEAKFDFAFDNRFDSQISNLVCVKSGKRLIFNVGKDDHLWDSFRVFSCSYWQNRFCITHPIKKKKMSKIPVITN